MALLVLLLLAAQDPTLGLPTRPPDAPAGSQFARSLVELPRMDRERRIVAQIQAGNVPPSLRRLAAVTVRLDDDEATYHVTPDYLAIGSDEDFFRTPLSPESAQEVADRLGCMLPTRKLVDQIYEAAPVKRTPRPIPPSPAMVTVPVFLEHDRLVREERPDGPLGVLTAGHKKDVVITPRLAEKPGRVAIYGWHRPDGRPIQPLYLGHTSGHVDYSHGIRLVLRRMTVNGRPTTTDAVLADPQLAPLLSDEGVVTSTRYEPAAP